MAVTVHTDASVNTNLWTNWQAGSPFHNGVPSDGGFVGVWVDADGNDVAWMAESAGSVKPVWRSTTPLTVLPSLDWDGADDFYLLWSADGSVSRFGSNIITATQFHMLLSIYIEGAVANDSSVWLNDCLIGDFGQYWGIFVRNNGGTITLNFYLFDTSSTVRNVSLPVSLNTRYVIAYYLNPVAGQLVGEIYATASGAVTSTGSVTSSAIMDISAVVSLCANKASGATPAPANFNGRIPEIIIDNAYNSAAVATRLAAFRTKHLTGGGGGGSIVPILHHHQRQQGVI